MTPELAEALGWDQPHEPECRCPRCVTERGSVPEPSIEQSGCSSKPQPSVCFRCGLVIFDGGAHRNGFVECYMDEVETS